ncbi:MAG: hypothetical protein QHH14_11795 [Clostridiales bacterium]|nr:hypothetical protein [Clostridiales bacterium]
MIKATSADKLRDVKIGPWQPGDELAILDCLKASFRAYSTADRWRHLFLDNPAGEPIIILGRSGDMVISHQSAIPRRFRVFGKEGIVGAQLDGMSRPGWRRKGIKTIVAEEVRRIAVERGYLAIYSFANSQSLHGIVKYQHRRAIALLPVLVRPICPIRLIPRLCHRLFRRLLDGRQARETSRIADSSIAGPLPDYSIARLEEFASLLGWNKPAFDNQHTELFENAEGIPPITLIRDARHLTWRYTHAPGCPYWQRNIHAAGRLQATVIVRHIFLFNLRLVLLMEWFWRTGGRAYARLLLRDAIRLGKAVRADGIAAVSMPGTLTRKLLKQSLFFPVPEFLLPKKSILTVGPETEGTTEVWFDRSNWYLTWGDGFVV